MEIEFKVGDLVRIGKRVPPSDPNYHKRGIIKKWHNKYIPVVELIDEWSEPSITFVDYLDCDFWELCEYKFPRFRQLL